jgi:hypothetical protein
MQMTTFDSSVVNPFGQLPVSRQQFLHRGNSTTASALRVAYQSLYALAQGLVRTTGGILECGTREASLPDKSCGTTRASD